jgi:hypothetical protein
MGPAKSPKRSPEREPFFAHEKPPEAQSPTIKPKLKLKKEKGRKAKNGSGDEHPLSH